MTKKDKILLIPHVGTAFGHIFRLTAMVDKLGLADKNVSIILPEQVFDSAKRFIHPSIQIFLRRTHFSINNINNGLDYQALLRVQKENDLIVQRIKPDLILDSPGISGGIISLKRKIPFYAVTHGCYLPFPRYFVNIHSDPFVYFDSFAFTVWNKLRVNINQVVKVASNHLFNTLEDILDECKIIIPSAANFEPSLNGNHVKLLSKRYGFSKGQKTNFLITTCSDGSTNYPSRLFLEKLVEAFGCITIAADPPKTKTNGVNFIDHQFNYSTLIDEESKVITHGGYGTLQMVSKAKEVTIVPGDFDQLYNALIAHHNYGYNVFISKQWIKKIKNGSRFIRRIDWDVVGVNNSRNKLFSKGIILKK